MPLVHLIHSFKAEHDPILALDPTINVALLQPNVVRSAHTVASLCQVDIWFHLHPQEASSKSGLDVIRQMPVTFIGFLQVAVVAQMVTWQIARDHAKAIKVCQPLSWSARQRRKLVRLVA